jgi:hypothetical protein
MLPDASKKYIDILPTARESQPVRSFALDSPTPLTSAVHIAPNLRHILLVQAAVTPFSQAEFNPR